MRHTICYVSTCARHLDKKEIDNILEQTKASNVKNNICGILIYADGNFFQILEGSKSLIKTLYSRILRDPRHHHLIKIFEKDIDSETFSTARKDYTSISGKKFRDYELQKYLKMEAIHNKNSYSSISYLINKFIYGESKHTIFRGSAQRAM